MSASDQIMYHNPFYLTKSIVPLIGGVAPTLSRASTGTYVDSDGLIKTAASNVMRFEHDPITGECLGFLSEYTNTNLTRYSSDLVPNTGWAGNILTSQSGTGLDGNISYQLTESTGNGLQSLGNTGTTTGSSATSVTSGTIYTGSIFLKKIAGSVDWVQLTFGSTGFGTAQYANFNISTGTLGNSSGSPIGAPPIIKQYANGWYRCSFTATATATVANTNNLIVSFTGNTDTTTRLPTYAGDTSNRFLATMAQFEALRYPSSYIRTTTAASVRSADLHNVTPTNFAGTINLASGTFLMDYIPQTSTQFGYIMSAGGDTTGHAFAKSNAAGTGIGDNWVARSSSVALLTTSGASSRAKLAYSYKTDEFILSVNGSVVGTDTLGTGVSYGSVRIGTGVTASNVVNTHGIVRSFTLFRRNLSPDKLNALSAL